MMMNVTVVCGGKWKNIQKERDRWKWRNKDNKKRRDGKSALLFSSSFIFDVRFRSLLLDFSRPACDTVASGTGKEFFFVPRAGAVHFPAAFVQFRRCVPDFFTEFSSS